MMFYNTFISTVTGKSYFIKDQLNCQGINVIYLITCSKYLEQYVGSAVKFKTRFCIYKSDIKTKKERCGSARILIVSVTMILIPFSTSRSHLLNRYIVII